MNRRSIRFRLIIWYAGLLGLLFIFLSTAGYFGFSHYLRQSLEKTLAKRAKQIGLTLLEQNDDASIVDDINKHYAPEINDRFLRITREDGKPIYISGLPKDGSFDPSHLPLLGSFVEQPFLRSENTLGSGRLIVYTLPFKASDERKFLVEVGVSSKQIDEPLHGLLVTLALGLPIVITIAIGGGYLLIRRSLLLVDEIAQTAERITIGNLNERLPIAKTGDELERLSVSLNNMINHLAEMHQHINRFSADASHELRTPLTILQCDLEAIMQKRNLSPEVSEAIGSAMAETQRLAKIVDGLLAVARLDAGEAIIELTRLDIASLTLTVVEQMRLLAEDKDIELTCDANERVMIEGDSGRLKQIVVNLLDNAIKYTPSGGSIKVIVTTDNGKAILKVLDTGMGISADALPHIFERFYRADKARSRELGGAGLGLSIVKSICAAHSGHIEVQSTEGQSTCFQITLPLVSDVVEKKQYV